MPRLEGVVGRTPPYFTPRDCAVTAWTGESAARCLAGRNVYVFGNSVARGFVYRAAEDFADATPVDRQRQKEACDKAADDRPDYSCVIPLPANGSALRFTWLQTFEHNPPGMPGDRCVPKWRNSECLVPLLHDSKPGDLLIFYLGLHLAIHRRDVLTANATFDFEAYVRATMAQWRATVGSAWHGNPWDVFRVRVAPLHESTMGQGFNAAVEALNVAADSAFHDAGWSVIDQWGINQGQLSLYDDHVHFFEKDGGPLSRAFWNVLLSSACPPPGRVV